MGRHHRSTSLIVLTGALYFSTRGLCQFLRKIIVEYFVLSLVTLNMALLNFHFSLFSDMWGDIRFLAYPCVR